MFTARSYRLLAVDDEPTNLWLLQSFLKGQGYQVDLAADGPTALAMMLQSPPDLVLLDLTMPLMDGYAVLHQMRQQPQLAAIPVIVVTAYDVDEVRTQVSRAGANDVIGKPVRFPTLLAMIQSYCPDTGTNHAS